MNNINKQINIKTPKEFDHILSSLLTNMFDLFEVAKEKPLPSKINGVQVYTDTMGMELFQVASQYTRPQDFLQTVLDLLHVMFDPYPMNEFGLNSNPCLLFLSLPKVPFQLGYVCEASRDGESIEEFWQEVIEQRLVEFEYDKKDSRKTLVIISTGDRMSPEFVSEMLSFFSAGVTADEVLDMIAVNLDGKEVEIKKPYEVGFCYDQSLGHKIRISMWLILE